MNSQIGSNRAEVECAQSSLNHEVALQSDIELTLQNLAEREQAAKNLLKSTEGILEYGYERRQANAALTTIAAERVIAEERMRRSKVREKSLRERLANLQGGTDLDSSIRKLSRQFAPSPF